jgi:hypothetical protein
MVPDKPRSSARAGGDHDRKPGPDEDRSVETETRIYPSRDTGGRGHTPALASQQGESAGDVHGYDWPRACSQKKKRKVRSVKRKVLSATDQMPGP